MSLRPKFKVAVAAMVRPHFFDEFAEWVDWHEFIGVEHFFIYDDTDNRALSKAFGGDGRLTFVNWLEAAPRGEQLRLIQTELMSRTLEAVRPSCEWLAFIDDDEFLISSENNLHQILDGLKNANAVGLEIFLRTFGTHNHKQKPEGLVLENFLTWQPRFLTKTICRPEYCRNAKRLNSLYYQDEAQPVYINGTPRTEPVLASAIKARLGSPIWGNLWLNHYVTKSEEHFKAKIERGCMTKPERGQTPGGRPVYGSKWDPEKLKRWGRRAKGMELFDWEEMAPSVLPQFKADFPRVNTPEPLGKPLTTEPRDTFFDQNPQKPPI